MNTTVTIDRDLFDDMVLILNVYYLLNEEPNERFTNLMNRLEENELNYLAGTDSTVVVGN